VKGTAVSEILLIFRKDFRHLKIAVGAMWVGAALLGWINSLRGLPAFSTERISPGLFVLVLMLYLMAALVQQERLAGNRQFWLTRPYDWRCLLLAKLAFVAFLVELPVVIASVLSLAVNSVSPLHYVPQLLFNELSWWNTFALPVIALAAVTEDLVQFAVASVAGLGLMAGGGALAERLRDVNRLGWNWPGLEWVRALAVGVFLLSVTMGLVLVQYARRRTGWSRCIMAAAIVLVAANPFFNWWHGAFALQSKLSQKPVNESDVRVSFVPGPIDPSDYRGAVFQGGFIRIPVTLGPLPPGTAVTSDRIFVAVETPDGKSWNSNWVWPGGLRDPNNPHDETRTFMRGAAYQEDLSIDPEFYRAVRDQHVRLRTILALTLLGDQKVASVSPAGRSGPLAGEAVCFSSSLTDRSFVHCSWPLQMPARSYLRVCSQASRRVLEWKSFGTGSYGPSIGSSPWESNAVDFPTPHMAFDLQLETWQAVAHFERTLDIPLIRLADYEVRSTGVIP
jgi:hypothetical protein